MEYQRIKESPFSATAITSRQHPAHREHISQYGEGYTVVRYPNLWRKFNASSLFSGTHGIREAKKLILFTHLTVFVFIPKILSCQQTIVETKKILDSYVLAQVLRFAGYSSRASVNGLWLSCDRHQTGYCPITIIIWLPPPIYICPWQITCKAQYYTHSRTNATWQWQYGGRVSVGWWGAVLITVFERSWLVVWCHIHDWLRSARCIIVFLPWTKWIK